MLSKKSGIRYLLNGAYFSTLAHVYAADITIDCHVRRRLNCIYYWHYLIIFLLVQQKNNVYTICETRESVIKMYLMEFH